MSTTKSEFQDLAQELMLEFADFAVSVVINKLGDFDYDTQAASVLATSTLSMIPYQYETKQFDGQKIKIGDYMLIGERQLIGFEPTPDKCQIIVDGAEVNLNRVEIDPAQASLILHVRPQ